MKDLHKSKQLPLEYTKLARFLGVGEEEYLCDVDDDKVIRDDELSDEEEEDGAYEDDGTSLREKRKLLDKMREADLAPYVAWDKIKYELETYYVSGACHTYNAVFGLALARMVEPDEIWKVRRGTTHTTVVNKDHTKVFDILYWCSFDNRLENYMFGEPVKGDDSTMGG